MDDTSKKSKELFNSAISMAVDVIRNAVTEIDRKLTLQYPESGFATSMATILALYDVILNTRHFTRSYLEQHAADKVPYFDATIIDLHKTTAGRAAKINKQVLEVEEKLMQAAALADTGPGPDKVH